MLRSHIDHCLETWICVDNLQRGTIHRRQWLSGKVSENCEKMARATARMEEHVQTMGRLAEIVDFHEVIASVIAIVIASWWETVAAE